MIWVTMSRPHGYPKEAYRSWGRCCQIGDIPTPDLIRRGRREGVGVKMGGRPGLTAVGHRVGRLHHPIEGRLRGQIHPLIRQRWHDLAGRSIGEGWLVNHDQDRRALVLTQAVSGDAPPGSRAATIGPEAIHRPPALQGTRGQPRLSQAWSRRAPAAQASSMS